MKLSLLLGLMACVHGGDTDGQEQKSSSRLKCASSSSGPHRQSRLFALQLHSNLIAEVSRLGKFYEVAFASAINDPLLRAIFRDDQSICDCLQTIYTARRQAIHLEAARWLINDMVLAEDFDGQALILADINKRVESYLTRVLPLSDWQSAMSMLHQNLQVVINNGLNMRYG